MHVRIVTLNNSIKPAICSNVSVLSTALFIRNVLYGHGNVGKEWSHSFYYSSDVDDTCTCSVRSCYSWGTSWLDDPASTWRPVRDREGNNDVLLIELTKSMVLKLEVETATVS